MEYTRLTMTLTEKNGLSAATKYLTGKILDSFSRSPQYDEDAGVFVDETPNRDWALFSSRGLFLDLTRSEYYHHGDCTEQEFVAKCAEASELVGVRFNDETDEVYVYVVSQFARSYASLIYLAALDLLNSDNPYPLKYVKAVDDGYSTIDGTTYERLAQETIIEPVRAFTRAYKKTICNQADYGAYTVNSKPTSKNIVSTYKLSEVATLTTEHPASSCGVPVLLIGDQAFGPGDIVDGHIPKNAFSFLNEHPTTAADYAFNCYCSDLPYGAKRLKSQAPELLVLFVGNFEHCHEPYASWQKPNNWIDFFFGVLDYYRVGK